MGGGIQEREEKRKEREGGIKGTNEGRIEQCSKLFQFIILFLNAGKVAEPHFPPFRMRF